MIRRHDKAKKIHELASSLSSDPLRFISLYWPEMTLYDKQREILLSLLDNLETFVHAANKTGKTRIAAVAALWFFLTRTPARVIISSSSESQLASILWSEIQQLIRSSKLRLPLVVNHLCIKKRRGAGSSEVESLDYLIGQVTNQVENFQGHHLPSDKPRVLAIFDEASGVPDEFFEAAGSWAHCRLVIGNPLSNTNFFYRLCKGGDAADPAGGPGLLRRVIHIDGRDSPNVQAGMRWKQEGRLGEPPVLIDGLLTYPEYLRREKTWDEVQRTTRLYGQFHEGDQTMLLPAPWLDAAMDPRRWADLEQQDRRVEAMGIDVAAGGRDQTCWTLVDRYGIIRQIVLDTPNTMEIAGRTISLIQEHQLNAQVVAMDAGGGGKQIADRLAEQGYPVLLVGFGESAEAKQAYKNRRAELYGGLRERLKPDRDDGGFLLPPDAQQLRQELAVLPLNYDSEGRLVLPSKGGSSARPGGTSIRQMLGRSPDRADSLGLAVWVLDRLRGIQDFSNYVFVYDDDSPLTPEEVAAMPDVLRGIYEMDDEPERQYNRRNWRDDGWW